MITTARPLRIKELLGNPKRINDTTVWCSKDQKEILTHKSWVSLHLIFKWFAEINDRIPRVLLPKFYCYDTLHQIENDAYFIFYDINDDFLPDIRQCKEICVDIKPDMFIFVHYFGFNLDENEAKVFCKNNNCILVEDGAHILLGEGKTGNVGDFVIYSPWKSLGLPDGAVLLVNGKGPAKLEQKMVVSEIQRLNEELPVYPSSRISKWKLKKIIQKMMPNIKRGSLVQDLADAPLEEAYCVSDYSKKKLLSYQTKEIETLGDKKRINFLVMEDLLNDLSDIKKIDINGIPYASSFWVNENIEIVQDRLSPLGNVLYRWPNLKPEFNGEGKIYELKQEIVHVANHDGMEPNYIFKKVAHKRYYKKNNEISLEKICDSKYEELCRKHHEAVPLIQTVCYAKAKEAIQGWKPEYWIINKQGEIIGFFLTLSKYHFVHRINRGPVVYNQANKRDAYEVIKRKFGTNLNVLFWAPEDEQTGQNINMMLGLRFRYRKNYFSTGYINLGEDEEILRKRLNSKWRNQLKSCEKLNYKVLIANDEISFMKLLEIHKADKNERNYSDSGDEITGYLYKNKSLVPLYVNNEQGEVISIVMIAMHGNTATYYIGWSNEEGYKNNVNRLLLWKGICLMKEYGLKWFDLGGIDVINTKSIADFKFGTGCSFKRLAGEFFSGF